MKFPTMVQDTEGGLAVYKNAQQVAQALGYANPSETPITRIHILDSDRNIIADAVLSEVSDMAQVRAAAVFLEGWVKHQDPYSALEEPNRSAAIEFGDEARYSLSDFVGEQISREATCPTKLNYWIFRKLFNERYPLTVLVAT